MLRMSTRVLRPVAALALRAPRRQTAATRGVVARCFSDIDEQKPDVPVYGTPGNWDPKVGGRKILCGGPGGAPPLVWMQMTPAFRGVGPVAESAPALCACEGVIA